MDDSPKERLLKFNLPLQTDIKYNTDYIISGLNNFSGEWLELLISSYL